jgi:hypothetical protein
LVRGLQLQQARFDKEGFAGENLNWSVELLNEGWARPVNARYLVVRLVNTGNQESFDLVLPNTDLRRAAPGEKVILSGTVPLPKQMSTGTYALWLGSPDPS